MILINPIHECEGSSVPTPHFSHNLFSWLTLPTLLACLAIRLLVRLPGLPACLPKACLLIHSYEPSITPLTPSIIISAYGDGDTHPSHLCQFIHPSLRKTSRPSIIPRCTASFRNKKKHTHYDKFHYYCVCLTCPNHSSLSRCHV